MEKNRFNEFYKFLKPYKKSVIMLLLLQLLNIGCSISVPYLLGSLIHLLEIKEIDFKLLGYSFLGLSSIYLIWNSTKVIVDITFEKINKGVENDIRAYCFSKIINSPMSKIKSQSEGEIISKVIRDTARIEKTFSSIFSLYDLALNAIGISIMMLLVNLLLGTIILLLFSLIAILHRFLSKPLNKMYSDYKNSEESLLTDFRNQLAGLFTIKVFSLEDTSIDILSNRNEKGYKDHMKLNTKVSIIKNINYFTTSVFRIGSVILGGVLYLLDKLNIGQIFAIHTYTIQLSFSLRNIVELDIILKDIKISFNRIMMFLEEYEDDASKVGHEIERIDSISFDNVSFKYEEKKLINKLSFKAKKGNIIGITGQNGSGKTTLTYLLCGFYKPNGILINNQSMNIYSETEILKNVSYVLQNTYLFPASIMNNLTCFRNTYREDVIKICSDIGLHEKIMKLKKGYETIVDEKNLNLSGGEKQLISLARALLKGSDVLILDEMNSALDSITEDRLLSNISKYFDNKIVFIISHRSKVFDLCNLIINLDSDENEIVEKFESRTLCCN